MSKLWKKILGIGCAAVIGCSALVGCGGGGGGGGSNAGNAGSIENYQWVDDPDFEAIDIMDRNVYDGGKGMDDGKLTIYHWMVNSLGSVDKANMPIYNILKEANGGFDMEATSISDWETNLATLYGTGNLPDIFVHMGPERPEDYQQFIEEGVLLPISDFVDEDNWPNIANHLKKFDYLRGNLPYAEGRHWSIPVDWTLEHTMYVRLDWIANLNKTAKLTEILTDELGHAPNAQELAQGKFTETGPKDLLEFYRLSRAFTLYDPDEDGDDNTYGYTDSRYEDFFADCWIFEAFDAGYDRMVNFGTEDEPDFKSSWANDNTKKAVAFMNNLFKNGYMDPAFASNSMADKQDKFCKGEVGMIEGHAWYNTILTSFLSANNSKGWTIEQASEKIGVFNPPKGENGTYGIKGNPNFWTVMCINAGLSDDEVVAALDLFDFLLSDEGGDIMRYGVEGTHYTLDNTKSDYTKYVAKGALLQKDTKGFNYTLQQVDYAAQLSAICNLSDGYYSPYQTNAGKIIDLMDSADEYATYEEYPFLSPDLYVEHWQELKSEAQKDFLTMIKTPAGTAAVKGAGLTWPALNNMASSGFNSSWNTYMNKFDSLGGNDMVEEYNETVTPTTAVRFVKA
ncbi:MAG: hypothetical protein IJY57_04925 [Clostridia bacterium]|nr:hypothetical protein [Clostridia bacterium]